MWENQYHGAGWGFNSPEYQQLRESADMIEATLSKAFTTGSGIVQTLDTGGRALRTQFLPRVLQQVSFEQDDAGMMKFIKKKKVPSNVIEWTDFLSYGSAGDGFVAETGIDGNFGAPSADDNFQRQTQTIKYLITSRTVSMVASLVQNISNPMALSEKGATLETVKNINLGIYQADSTLSGNQFNGFPAQILAWVNQYPNDADLLFDMGGQPINRDVLETIAEKNRLKFGRANVLMSSVAAYGDIQRALWPQERYSGGEGGSFGIDKRTFRSTRGEIKLMDDIMLRPNAPLVADGNGLDGKPRLSTTQSPNALNFAVTPWVSAAAAAAGTGRYWQNKSLNTDTAAMSTAPELPSASYGGNAANRLAVGSYYYAVAPVYQGLEGIAWVLGAASAGTITSATAVTVSSGSPIVAMVLDNTTPAITGLGTTYARSNVKYRVYRYGGPGTTGAPTSLSQFDYLCDCGTPSAGNSTVWDNGMWIPGTDIALFLTEKKNGADGFFLAQLLPLMKRELPHLAMADLFAILAFVAPILWVPRHHILLRNIGRAPQ